LLSKPYKASQICQSLAEKIKSTISDFDLILSPAMGGIVIGYEIGRLLKKETIFSERINGEFKLRRDFFIKKGSKVIIVEDVITTGKSSLECSKLIKDAEAMIAGYACIIDRTSDKSLIKNKIISQIQLNIPTYTKENLPENLLSMKPIKPGSRNI
jgi:orotate phosphoribosyltransferase